MRITVKTIVEHLAAGDSPEEIIEAFPFLEKEDIAACLEFAAKMAANPMLIVSGQAVA